MNFQTLLKVETDEFYVGKAFRQGTKYADKARGKSFNSALGKSRHVELERMKGVKESIAGDMNAILKSFPSIDTLPEFYLELVKLTIDYQKLKKSLGAVKWARDKVAEFYTLYASKINRLQDAGKVNSFRKMFYGRAASALKQIRKELAFLEDSRRKMKAFPSIKTGMKTIVIAGYPNVGKTTLLTRMTGADPKIAPYPFTTQQIMLGYMKHGEEKVQVVDTPGLLDRSLEKRNRIERQAILALKHLAAKLIFMIDPSEACGYPVEVQVKLLKEVKNNFGIEMIVALNKSDLAERGKMEALERQLKGFEVIAISAQEGKGIDRLIKVIMLS